MRRLGATKSGEALGYDSLGRTIFTNDYPAFPRRARDRRALAQGALHPFSVPAFSHVVACGAVPEALYLAFYSLTRGFRRGRGSKVSSLVISALNFDALVR